MNRSRIDQFRRSQIYTPPPADYVVDGPPLASCACPSDYLACTNRLCPRASTIRYHSEPKQLLGERPRGLGRKWLPAGWLVYGALLFLAGFCVGWSQPW